MGDFGISEIFAQLMLENDSRTMPDGFFVERSGIIEHITCYGRDLHNVRRDPTSASLADGRGDAEQRSFAMKMNCAMVKWTMDPCLLFHSSGSERKRAA